MAITFQKRQKEMKRLEKQRAKQERRAQKKLGKLTEGEATDNPELQVEGNPDAPIDLVPPDETQPA